MIQPIFLQAGAPASYPLATPRIWKQQKCTALRNAGLTVLLMSLVELGGCAHTFTPPDIAYDNVTPATLTVDPPPPVKIVEIPQPLPLPGQLKPLDTGKPAPEASSPTVRVSQANAAARVEPFRSGFINAVQVYPFSGGALYQVYCAPGKITDIALEEGELLNGSGPVAAGDTVRWIIGDTESGTGPTKKIHILVKPTRSSLTTNLIVNTNRRTYLIEMHAMEKTYMASVSWQYPEGQLIALHRQNQEAEAAAPLATAIDLTALAFRYRIEGDSPPWRPLRAFDDGQKVYIEFPAGIGQGEMPPLFVIGPAGDSDLVNYRVRGNYYIVDHLFAAAELRLGDKDSERHVRIIRTDGVPRGPFSWMQSSVVPTTDAARTSKGRPS
jgi:type IV secretion system protein VirB9